MEGGEKLAEGGYGCVFRPEIGCDGKDTNDMNFVSKLQVNDFSAENEISIGKILTNAYQNAPREPLKNNFAPVVSACKVDIANIQPANLNACNVVKKQTDPNNFILMKIRFMGDKDLDNYILSNSNANLIILTLIKAFNHILQSIQLLINQNVVHFDLKGPNIIFDSKKTLPVIIDFGLSLPMNILNSETIYNYFYIYAPQYYIWPLEVHYINLLLHITPTPTESEIKELAQRYTKGNAALDGMSAKFKDNYKDLCIKVLMRYNELPYKERLKKLMNYKAWTTWDNYSLAVIYLRYLYLLTKTENFVDNNFLRFMTELLLTNIHPDFNKRFSVPATLKAFDEFLGNAQKNDLAAIENVITTVRDNKKQINKSIIINQRKIRSLTEQTMRI